MERGIAQVDRIHQDLSQIEERVMIVELRVIWAGLIGNDLILDFGSGTSARHVPAALIYIAYAQRFARSAFCSYPIHILREVTHLVKSVPDRQLQIDFG